MDSVDFSLDAWLPFPGFLWLYGEDESTLLPTIRDVAGLALLGKIVGLARLGVSLPWLWVRKSCRLVAISPFACRLALWRDLWGVGVDDTAGGAAVEGVPADGWHGVERLVYILSLMTLDTFLQTTPT